MFQRQKKNRPATESPQAAKAAPKADSGPAGGDLDGWRPPATTTPRKATRPTKQDPERSRSAPGRVNANGQRTTSYPQGTQGAPSPTGAPRTTSYPSPLTAGRRGYKSIN